LINGDSVVELKKIEDNSINLVITDPPYGIAYKSNRSKSKDHITRQGIRNDTLNDALNLFDKTCKILNQKTKENAHFYTFTSWKVYPYFYKIIEKHWNVKNLIIWNKGNHGAGDLYYSWGNQYEMIIFATKGNKRLNVRRSDIINVSRLASKKLIHPTQKPTELIKELLKVSAQDGDTVCDPFMGSGSAIKAVKEFGNLNYIGIEIDPFIFEKAKAFIGGC
jgi:site-specific DNA-methyltransferase (adenine-specific)